MSSEKSINLFRIYKESNFQTILKNKRSVCPILCSILETLHSTHAKNLNLETEKSEQTLFGQISLSQDKGSSTACATKHFKDHNKTTETCGCFCL